MRRITVLIFLALPLLLTGCATPKYACGVPDGLGCKPLSEIHRMAQEGSLENRTTSVETDQTEQDGDDGFDTDDSLASVLRPRQPPGLATVKAGTPLLIQPRTLRVWVAPWPDEGGTLHDETYLYLRLDNGRWVMERP